MRENFCHINKFIPAHGSKLFWHFFEPPPSCLVSIGPADGVIALLTVFFKESSSLIVACNGVSSFLPIVARFHCLNLGFNLV